MQVDEKVFALGVVVAVLIGFGVGYLAFGSNQQQPAKLFLSEEDKNFLIGVARDQIDLTTRITALQAANLDWCTANGGAWNYVTQQATLPVSKEQAANLLQQGVDVQQLPDGSFVAQALVLAQNGCILVPTANK
ncbi:MAG: hypothetical protein QXD98_03425 [Candidatus Diapherotrites archaeon]